MSKVYSTYIAGVYEQHLDDQGKFVEYNLKTYNSVASDAKKLGVDILVFPEEGIYPDPDLKAPTNFSLYVPNPVQKISPCYYNNFSSVMKNLSCLAKQYEMYIVANVNEIFDCNNITQKELNDTRDCGLDKVYFFNTNIAFDRNGTVIARYRKHNLYGEYGEVLLNSTIVPTISIFNTDFNVSFGLFTCFDILFDKPTLMLVKNYNIRHVIFPTRWMSELPFLTALQIQEGWAYVNSATLLASNVNDPKYGSTGSGIYQARTKNNVYYATGKEESTLIISEVSKDNRYLPHSKYIYKIYPKVGESILYENKHPPANNNESISIQMLPCQMNNYSFKPLPLNKDKIHETVCQNTVCCEFNVSLSRNTTLMNLNSTYYKYQFVIRDGVRSFSSMANGGIQLCGIVACTTNNTSSCGLRFPDYNKIDWPITFENITIRANFPEKKTLIHFPNTLNASIMPILPSSWSWERKDTNTIVYKLNKPQNYLLTFGIFGRNFDFDSSPRELLSQISDNNSLGFALKAADYDSDMKIGKVQNGGSKKAALIQNIKDLNKENDPKI
ncbi:vanin-like protein 2 [Chrysoperla carnea]|uniref:vanin-like protein 2 n=1 Tax=Chrysoperla carnea TaxID=189513 RepID=UPI001D05F92B|nr:vanin-like protein 2 [Chrysoperla carnea]